MLHQDEGGIGKSIPDARKISRDPRDFPRVEGNLEDGGDGFANTSRVLVEYGHSLSINFTAGSGPENPSLWAVGRIDSVKINPSLLIMREWKTEEMQITLALHGSQ